ncbi:MAG TPA: outer membrane beta-barrel protein [Terriglobales bacterium]|nr:outer membrane beta-barrel protein [Terriglobales bacterium]
MFRRLSQCVFAALLVSGSLFAQDNGSSVSVNLTGVLNKNSSAANILQAPTNSAGFLATYRFNLNRHSGIDLNYGYTRNTQNYNVSDTSGSLQAGVHETTAAYVFKIPFGKVTPFLMAGSGALIFNPTANVNNISGADTQARAAFLYGGGFDYNVVKNVGLRVQYRGLLYKAPDFGLPDLSTDSITHRAEPTVGIVFHF